MKPRKTVIHADLYSVRHFLYSCVCPHIGMSKLMHTAEGKERLQLELDGFISFKDGEPDHRLLLVMNQQTLLPHNDITYPEGHPRNILNIKILNIFMTFGTVIITMVFSDACVETLPVADDSCVKRLSL